MATKVILSGGDETARLAATNTSESGIIKHNSTSGLIYVGDGTTAWKDMTKANTVAVDASRVTGVTGLAALTSATVANDDVLTIWDTSASAPKKIAKSDLVAGGSGGDIDTTSATLDHVIINITSINNPTTPWVPTYAGTDVYDVTALARDLTINTPTGYGVDGYASLVIRISAITLDRTITPSGYTIIGGGTTFTVAAGTTRVFSVKRYDSTWTWDGNLLATDIPDLSATYQPKDATLTALASVTTAADKLIYATASDTFSTTDITSTARSILDDTSTSAVLTTIGAQPLDATLTALAGVTTVADKMIYATASDTFSTTTVTAAARGLLDDADTATMLTTLGAAASGHNHSGTYQPADATLTALAGVTTAADKLIYATAADTFSTTDITSTARSLLDDTSTSAMLTTLGAAATSHTHSGYQATIDNTVDVTAKTVTANHLMSTVTTVSNPTSPYAPDFATMGDFIDITNVNGSLTINKPSNSPSTGFSSHIIRVTTSGAQTITANTSSNYTIVGGASASWSVNGTREFSVWRVGSVWYWQGDLATTDIPDLSATYQPKDATLTALADVTVAADKLIYATGADAFSTTDITATARSILDDTSTGAVLTTIGAQPLDATLTALAGVTTAANKLIYATASDTFSTTDITAAGRAILDDADAAAQLTTLGAAASGHNHSGTYQPVDATLTALAGVTTSADKLIYATAADTFSTTDLTSTARSILDDTSVAAVRTTIGATRATIDAEAASNVDLSTNTTLTKASHQGKLLNCTAAVSLTVDNSTDFDAWGECQIYAGGGIVTVVATATVRRVGSDPLTIPQYGRAVLMRNSTTDEYVLTGRLA